MTAPHIGNTGVNDEDPESRRIWVAGYVVRDPARVVVELALAGAPSTTSSSRRASSASAASTPARSPAPARARRDARRHLLRRRRRLRRRASCSRMVREAPADGRRRPRRRGRHRPSRTSSRPIGERIGSPSPRSTSASRRMTPQRLAERGIEVHVLPADRDARGRLRASSPTACSSPTARATRPPPTHQVDAAARACWTRGIPFFGICFGNQMLGRALGFGTYKLAYGHRGINQPVLDRATGKVEITAHNHGFAVDAPARRASPTPRYGRVEVSHVVPQRRRRRGPAAPRPARRSRCSTTPRRRPARTTPTTSSTGSSTSCIATTRRSDA